MSVQDLNWSFGVTIQVPKEQMVEMFVGTISYGFQHSLPDARRSTLNGSEMPYHTLEGLGFRVGLGCMLPYCPQNPKFQFII